MNIKFGFSIAAGFLLLTLTLSTCTTFEQSARPSEKKTENMSLLVCFEPIVRPFVIERAEALKQAAASLVVSAKFATPLSEASETENIERIEGFERECAKLFEWRETFIDNECFERVRDCQKHIPEFMAGKSSRIGYETKRFDAVVLISMKGRKIPGAGEEEPKEKISYCAKQVAFGKEQNFSFAGRCVEADAYGRDPNYAEGKLQESRAEELELMRSKKPFRGEIIIAAPHNAEVFGAARFENATQEQTAKTLEGLIKKIF